MSCVGFVAGGRGRHRGDGVSIQETRQPAAPDQALIDGEGVGKSEMIWMPMVSCVVGWTKQLPIGFSAVVSSTRCTLYPMQLNEHKKQM